MSEVHSGLRALFRFGFEFQFQVEKELAPVVPVFHRWIQEQSFPGHLLLDVHDYRHVVGGPGVLLVAHEMNISLAVSGRQAVLQYYRKRPRTGAPIERLRSALRAGLTAADCLASELTPASEKAVEQLECRFFSNDRLLFPNQNRINRRLSGMLREILRSFSRSPAEPIPEDSDFRERFSVRLPLPPALSLKELINRLPEEPCCCSGSSQQSDS